SATPWNEWGDGVKHPITPQGSSPLTAGWTAQPNGCGLCAHVTAPSAGTVVLAAEVIPTGTGVNPGTYPVYLELTGNTGHFWLHYQQPSVPDPAFWRDFAG